jgi:uncharacterized membrane-anchored protein YjiN (DUF445 family)
MTTADPQARDLVRMKRLALALLCAAALLYALATALRASHAAWGYIAAFSEAAMVGAIADWFAVVALFRHPLGLPIPHTAIIARNKARLGDNLATFLCRNFLSTEQVLDKLRHFDTAGKLAAWLANPAHAAQLSERLASVLRYGLDALDDERVRRFVGDTALAALQRLDLSRLAGQLLDVLTAHRRHQALLDEVLLQIGALLGDDDVKDHIARVIAAEVNYLRFVGLDNLAGQYAMNKIVAAVGSTIGEMGADPEHPLRQRFDAFMADFIEKLKDDPEMHDRVEAIKRELLAHPVLGAYLHGLWNEVLAWLHADFAKDSSTLRTRMALVAQGLGGKLRDDPAMQRWINDQLLDAAPRWIERYREDIRRYIVTRVDAWETRELIDELERNIGRDLQFVRINGTLVGGLIGLTIHALTQWMVTG